MLNPEAESMKVNSLTLKSVVAALAPYPVKVKRNEFGEYVVRAQGAEYFTDDLEDAFRTAFSIAFSLESGGSNH